MREPNVWHLYPRLHVNGQGGHQDTDMGGHGHRDGQTTCYAHIYAYM